MGSASSLDKRRIIGCTVCKWINWKEYLADPKIPLIEKKGLKLKKGGNPWINGEKTKSLNEPQQHQQKDERYKKTDSEIKVSDTNESRVVKKRDIKADEKASTQ